MRIFLVVLLTVVGGCTCTESQTAETFDAAPVLVDARVDGARVDGARADGASQTDLSTKDHSLVDTQAMDTRGVDAWRADIVFADNTAADNTMTVPDVAADRQPIPDASGQDLLVPDGFRPDVEGVECPEDMVLVPWPVFCIDRYEASRGSQDQAVSERGVLPWVNVSWTEAEAACQAAGKQLCEGRQWLIACGGREDDGQQLPYGPVYNTDSCNGEDYAAGSVVATGSIASCEGFFDGIFDMSGNAWEWIAPCWLDSCWIRGGAYDEGPYDLTCRSYSGNQTADDRAPNIGFRCCKLP